MTTTQEPASGLARAEQQARALLDQPQIRSLGRVHAPDLVAFARACGETDPRLLDPSRPDFSPHPMYIVSLLRGNKSAEDHEFRPDGMYCDEVPGTEGLDVALMAGGQEVRWHLPLPLGEPIEMERRLVSVDRKGRGGNPFLLLTVEKSYTTVRGRLIAGVTERFIVR